MEFEYLINKKMKKIELEEKGGVFWIKGEKTSGKIDIRSVTSNIISLFKGNKSFSVYHTEEGGKKYFCIQGCQAVVQMAGDEEETLFGAGGHSGEDVLLIKAPMPGKVIKISVSEKEEVRKNQTLAVVEAMKMENEIKSSLDGMVKKIYVKAGDLVNSEKLLIELEQNDESAE